MKKFIILLTFYSASSFAFSDRDTLGNYHFQIAEKLYTEGIYDSSSYHYNLAADFYLAEGNWREAVICKNYAGTNYRYLSRYDEAFTLLNNALNLCLEKGGDKDSLLADIYNSIGSAYYEKEDFDNALLNYEKSMESSLIHWGINHKNTGRAYHNIGLIYYRTADAEKALLYFNKALAIWLPQSGGKTSNIGNCYINLANTYFLLEEYEKAIEYDLKALEVWKEVLGDEHQYIAMSYSNIADDYLTLKKYNESLDYFEKSLSIRENIFGKYHPETGSSLLKLAKLYTDINEYKKARIFFDSCYNVFNNIPDHPNKYTAYLEEAKLFLIKNEYEKALKNYQKVLAYILPEIDKKDSDIDLVINSGKLPSAKFDFWTSLSGIGNIFYYKFFAGSNNTSDLINSFKWYQRFADVLEIIRKNFRSETSKIFISKNISQVIPKLIRIAINLYELTGDEKYKEKAFNFSEKSKAAVLLSFIAESGAKKFSGIPDSLIAQEKVLKTELAFLETKIQEAEEVEEKEAVILNLKEKFFNLNNDYENIVTLFENNFPEYYQLKYKSKEASTGKIRSSLDNNSSLIKYFVDDSLVCIFTFSNKNFEIKYLKNSGLTRLIENFRISLQNLDFDLYIKSADSLYKFLIKPVYKTLEGKEKLYIIPDGILNHLPFEVLISDIKNHEINIDFKNLSYLLNDFEISYHYSANLLLKEKENSSKKRLSFAGFAPVFPDETEKETNQLNNAEEVISTNVRAVTRKDKTYSSLPESEKEIKEISNLFKSNSLISKEFFYNEASESLIKSEEIKNYNCIHLATHGFINDRFPKLSGLLFHDEVNLKEDGFLYSGEIYNLNLNADLVVLSACESGLGKIVKGEGIIGLTRGFIYSGAKNIIVSLWQVADKSTSELMIEFYRNILEGKSYASSLREAKLKLIKDGIYSYPLEWSPFVLIGK